MYDKFNHQLAYDGFPSSTQKKLRNERKDMLLARKGRSFVFRSFRSSAVANEGELPKPLFKDTDGLSKDHKLNKTFRGEVRTSRNRNIFVIFKHDTRDR